MEILKGGFQIREADVTVLNKQREITKKINDHLIQVGAVYLKMSGKSPISDDWAKSNYHDTNLQDWIDHEDKRLHNVGFNLQQGWVDIDIDYDDPLFNKLMLAALDHNGVDTRFRFGRRSVGFPTHVMVQLGEEEASNYENLRKFEPKAWTMNGKRCHVELRSMPANIKSESNLMQTAKQTVMPGSIYVHKTQPGEYDISVWYSKDGVPADNVTDVAATTPRRTDWNALIRSIAFAVFAYAVRDKWVEGNRQSTATRMSGWLARVVRDSRAMNNNEVISKDVWCPVDDDSVVESLLEFVCKFYGDEELHMRIRTYYDAVGKLERNPDAKITGWPAVETALGSEMVNALRTVFTPGSDVSVLTKMAERYIYDESDNKYIDRVRHLKGGTYTHTTDELVTRHKSEVVRINGKAKEAFRIFESSDMRRHVDSRDMYPDLTAGGIFRFSTVGDVLADEDDEAEAVTIFNTWRGWPVSRPERVDEHLLADLEARLDQLLAYLTCDNKDQADWVKKWVAWTFQHPGKKQQIAWVCVGGQGVGKSFFGNTFMRALMGRLWGAASPKVLEGNFSVEPFIDNMFVFIDEAKFNGDAAVDEIKKMVRNVDVGGAEKYEKARNYRIFARIMFASNRADVNAGQQGVIDRALFYTKAYDKEHLGVNEMQFRVWAESIKPWFREFADLMERRDVREHYMELFHRVETTLEEVESIKHSSSSDPMIINANMSWARRVAKYILENARIYEDLDITHPFTLDDLNNRVVEVAKQMGLKSVQGARVLAEFTDAGLLERVSLNRKTMLRFKSKWADTLDAFAAATGVVMEPHFEAGPEDYGPNDNDGTSRVPWKGAKQVRF